jgi:Domain of unknown function (DUF1707)
MNQSPWQPGRPAVRQVWMWPPPGATIRSWPAESREIRIGDAERDRAVAELGDHYATGRLTREEFDERIEQAMQARFDRDLRPLFADLPVGADSEPSPSAMKGWRMGLGIAVPLLFWLLPVLFVALVIAAVALSAPWMFWGLFWLFMISRVWAHRRFSGGSCRYR